MKEIELDNKEIELVISALDLKISRDLDRVYNNVLYPFTKKEEYRKGVATMELLIDKLLSKRDEVESEEVLTIDWNMKEFKEKLKEVIEEVLV
ncbi:MULTISPECIES: hypothetical protein [unclassified Clostridioides]|uniref:hypothetical protein n=1 Tax=unclassified Clostridioides TaxID=2635829 RepID=UPI001D125CD3|nr:hypothetical protein [Clostridioides sp. ES-S-0049-03]MCC0677310.1 hypothetical protein [Clostridioides sp. ES-W-0018-02]MCC0712459.1 hypothetical protein [Clostridioides sp. ES-W-0017-02]